MAAGISSASFGVDDFFTRQAVAELGAEFNGLRGKGARGGYNHQYYKEISSQKLGVNSINVFHGRKLRKIFRFAKKFFGAEGGRTSRAPLHWGEEGEAAEEVGAGEFVGAENDVVNLNDVDVHLDAAGRLALRRAAALTLELLAEGDYGSGREG